jgi:hypothetical protein
LSPPKSWFSREPLRLDVGQGSDIWSLQFSGFVEADYIYDSTRSFDEGLGSALVARSDSYAGTEARGQFSVRNTRLGLTFRPPTIAGVKTTARIEGDFFGNQPRAPGSGGRSEKSFWDSPGFRLRHAYVLLQSEYVDLLFGHAYAPLGFQNYFFPCTISYFGIPNQVFARVAQLRASRIFELGVDFALEVIVAAVRPAERDSSVPDAEAGVRLAYNRWKGMTTPGNLGTIALPMSVGVSSTLRRFKVNAFTPPPTQASTSTTGWGLVFDALIPIIAAEHSDDRSNRLTLTGEFVTGSGIADLITEGAGATFPSLPNPMMANPAPTYVPNVDEGQVTFDAAGHVRTIDWWTTMVGLQWYLPPTGRWIIAANYTTGYSGNMRKLFASHGDASLLTRVGNRTQYADVNVLWDATPAVRFSLSGQYAWIHYLDGDAPHNLRAMAQAAYAF